MANEDGLSQIDMDPDAGYNPGVIDQLGPSRGWGRDPGSGSYATLAMLAQQGGLQPQRGYDYDRARTRHTSAEALKALYSGGGGYDPEKPTNFSTMNFGDTGGSTIGEGAGGPGYWNAQGYNPEVASAFTQMPFGAARAKYQGDTQDGPGGPPSPYAAAALAQAQPNPQSGGSPWASPYAGGAMQPQAPPGAAPGGAPGGAPSSGFGGGGMAPGGAPAPGGQPQISYRIHPPAPGQPSYQAPDFMAQNRFGPDIARQPGWNNYLAGQGPRPPGTWMGRDPSMAPPGQPRAGPADDGQWSNVQLDQFGQPGARQQGPGAQPFATSKSAAPQPNPNSWQPPPPDAGGAAGGATPMAGQGSAGDDLAKAVGPPPTPPKIISDQDVKNNFDRTHPGLQQQNPKMYWESLGQQLHANKLMTDQQNQQLAQAREHWQQSYDLAKAVQEGNRADFDKGLKQTELEMNTGAAMTDKAQKEYDRLKDQMTKNYGIDSDDPAAVKDAGSGTSLPFLGKVGGDVNKANAVKDLWDKMQAQRALMDQGQKMITDAGSRWDAAHKISQQKQQQQGQGGTPSPAATTGDPPPQSGDQAQAAPAQDQAPQQASAPGAPEGIAATAKDLAAQFNKEPPATPKDEQDIQNALIAKQKAEGTYGSLNLGAGAGPKLVKHAMDAINRGIPRWFVMQMINGMDLADQAQKATPSVKEMGQRLRQPYTGK